jgi:outer membrane protein assembly factor BamB
MTSNYQKIVKYLLVATGSFLILIACLKPHIAQIDIKEEFWSFTANGNFARNGFQKLSFSDTLVEENNIDLSGLPVGSILVLANNLIYTTFNGYLYFSQPSNNNKSRKIRISDGTGTAPTVFENLVFIASNHGNYGLTIYNAREGKIVWEHNGMLSQSAPVIFGNLVIHASLNGHITAFNMYNYTKKWSVEPDDKILNSMALHGENLIVATQNGIIKNYNPENGSLRWSREINSAVYASPVVNEESVFICAYNGEIFRIDLESGDLVNSQKKETPIYITPSLDNQFLYVPLANGHLIAMDKNSLQTVWETNLEGPFSASILVTLDKIIAGTSAARLFILNKKDGSVIQSLKLEGRPKIQPLLFEDKIYISCEPDLLITYATKRNIE